MAKTTELTAENLKNQLWETLNDVRSGKMDAGKADTVASQAREIVRVTALQLRIASQGQRQIPLEVLNFSESK